MVPHTTNAPQSASNRMWSEIVIGVSLFILTFLIALLHACLNKREQRRSRRLNNFDSEWENVDRKKRLTQRLPNRIEFGSNNRIPVLINFEVDPTFTDPVHLELNPTVSHPINLELNPTPSTSLEMDQNVPIPANLEADLDIPAPVNMEIDHPTCFDFDLDQRRVPPSLNLDGNRKEMEHFVAIVSYV